MNLVELHFLNHALPVFIFLPLLPLNVDAQSAVGWSMPLQINEGQRPSHNPAMVSGAGREVFVVWEERWDLENEDKSQLYFREFDGTCWRQPVAITDTGNCDWTPDIALDTLGNPHVVWGEYLSGEILYMYFDGALWSEPINISSTPGASFYPRIAIDHANKLHIVWHDDTPQGNPSVYYRQRESSQWSDSEIISDTLEYSIFPKIVIDSEDNLHVVWCSRESPRDNRDVFYRSCLQGTWGDIVRLTDDSLYSINPVLTLSKTGLPRVFWQQTVDLSEYPIVERAYWSYMEGSAWSQPEAIVASSRAEFPSVTSDYEGNVHIAFQQLTRVGQSNYDSVMYTCYVNREWSQPVNISGAIGKRHSGKPVIRTDTEGCLHLVWVSYGEEWPIHPEIYYARRGSIVRVEKPNDEAVPVKASLQQNFPNPFNSRTRITFSLRSIAFVSLDVYDQLGRRVVALVNSELGPGTHSVFFNGSTLGSGIYFCQLRVNGQSTMRKMSLIR